jgi:hypothetical protein
MIFMQSFCNTFFSVKAINLLLTMHTQERINFRVGHLHVPLGVLTVTTRILLYFPGRVSVITAVGQWDDEVLSSHWPTTVITETHPRKDNSVRVVTVRTPKGTCKRPTLNLFSPACA